jgi:ABC-2 type transport system ATP-binding protein/sodium transport system ATP-binding protein
LARALIHDPPVMMLDEPTLGLDVVGSQVIFDYIALLKQQDKAVILCTHRLEQAQRVCSKFGLLHQGKMVMRGTMDEIRSQSGQKDLVDVFIRLIKNHDSTVGAQP